MESRVGVRLSTSGAVGAVVADECVIRETVAVAAWHSRDRRRCEVAFARPMTLRGGIRETDDVVRWHSRDRRRLESGIRETDDVARWHSRD